MKKITLSLIITLMCFFPVFSSISFNDVVCAFSPSQEKIQLQDNMIAGAASFLSAQSKALQLLSTYERDCKGNLDISTALAHARGALKDLEVSRTQFKTALELGKLLGYNEAKRSMFTGFNFEAEMVKRKLNSPVADKVRMFLSNMDVVGLYQENLKNVDNIIITTQDITITLEAGQTPGVESMWRLLQEFSEAVLFGNYSTVIGSQILQTDTENGPPICIPD